MPLTFGPDLDDVTPGVLTEVSAVPTQRGYAAPPTGVDLLGAVFVGTPQGGALLTQRDGSSRTFVGTSTRMYEFSGGAWTDRSRAGNYAAGTARWRYAQFGDTELAINKATVLQSSTTGALADVANSPKAACMEVVRGFLMLANTDDTGLGITGGPNADDPDRWWCSQSFNAVGTWAPSVTTQATTGKLVATEGAITGLKRLLDECIVYKAKSIYVGRYVGPPVVWEWTCVSQNIGCITQQAVVNAGTTHYFIGDDDIYAFDGTRPVAIGAPVREWFFANLNKPNASLIQSLHDRNAQRIYWFYPTSSDTLDGVLSYNYVSQKWGASDQTVKDVLETITGTITYDNLGATYATYDAMPDIAYDSPYWIAGTPVLAYISATNYLTSLSGSGTAMTLRTGWIGDETNVTLCDRVKPRFRIAPTSGTLTSEGCMYVGEMATTGPNSTLGSGYFDVLQAARYHRFTLTLSGSSEVEELGERLKPYGEY